MHGAGMYWRAATLGEQRERIEHEVVVAIWEAHRDAAAAQHAQRSRARDTYGHTLNVAMHEILNDRLRAIPGIVFRKPAGERSRFEFPIVEATNTVIVPIRFSTDARLRHTQVDHLDLSDLRLALLAGLAPPKDPDLFDAIADEDYEVTHKEAVHTHDQLEQAGRAVVAAFGSTPDQLFETGLAQIDINDPERGAISWRRWHPLPVYADVQSIPPAPQLRVVQTPEPIERFDSDNEANDNLGYRLRPRTSPASDPETRQNNEPASDSEGTTP